jgi:hypothetical protein
METSVNNCESCNKHKGVGKNNYPWKVEFLTALISQNGFHTCTSLLDKRFEDDPCIYKCKQILNCDGVAGDCFLFQPFRTSNLLSVTWISQLYLFYSVGKCRVRQFLAVFRSFDSSSSYTFSCQPSPPVILPSSFSSFRHLFRGLPLILLLPSQIHIQYFLVNSIFFHSLYISKPTQSM